VSMHGSPRIFYTGRGSLCPEVNNPDGEVVACRNSNSNSNSNSFRRIESNYNN
jgi:hypothetical protein